MSQNLKNRPRWHIRFRCWFDSKGEPVVPDIMEQWARKFHRKMKTIQKDPQKWWKENEEEFHARFQHHSASGIGIDEVITFLIEKEVLGISWRLST